MKSNLKKIITLFICVLFITDLFSVSAGADTGPKPSVRVSFKNMGDELCFGTLLSKNPSTGPNSVWNGNEDDVYNDGCEIDIWRAFVDYEDSDGFYFLQITWQVNEKKELAWTYYPPESFKILLYYPETEKFVVSDICERYAFDTYYTVDMMGVDIGSVDYDENLSNNDRLKAYKSYEYTGEIISLFARILITLTIEMCVAFLFGFRTKRALLLLVSVNALTQIILNVLLNIINFNSGEAAFFAGYIMLEILVFAAEALLYAVYMNKFSEKAKSKAFYVIYSFWANAVSFALGLFISNIVPGIF